MSNTPVFVLLLSSAAALPGDGDYTTLHWVRTHTFREVVAMVEVQNAITFSQGVRTEVHHRIDLE